MSRIEEETTQAVKQAEDLICASAKDLEISAEEMALLQLRFEGIDKAPIIKRAALIVKTRELIKGDREAKER